MIPARSEVLDLRRGVQRHHAVVSAAHNVNRARAEGNDLAAAVRNHVLYLFKIRQDNATCIHERNRESKIRPASRMPKQAQYVELYAWMRSGKPSGRGKLARARSM